MKRPNSRNSHNDQLDLNPHRLGSTGAQNTFHPPTLQHGNLTSDLYKASTQQMHQMIDEIDLPNDSLTISSYSQSPHMVRSGLQFSQTHRMEPHHHDLETLGRSGELEGTYNDTNKTSTVKSLNMTGGRPDQQHYIQGSQSKQTDSEEEDPSDYSHDKMNQDVTRNLRHPGGTTSEDVSGDEYLRHGRDSPDFNRNNQESNDNDDLTISHTMISNTNTTYRGFETQNTRRGASNRTFADSVIDHQQQKSKSHNKSGHRKDKRKCSSNKHLQGYNGGTDDNLQDSDDCKSIIEREDESNEEDNEDSKLSSDISGVDSFTQTQYSKFSRLGHSRHFPKLKAPTLDEDLSALSKRSPNLQRIVGGEHDESLHYTPSSLEGKWIFTQKSQLGGQNSIDRTVQSDLSNNPLNKLTTVQGGINNQRNYMLGTNGSSEVSGLSNIGSGRNMRSLQRDPELEEALDDDSQVMKNNRNNESKEEQRRSSQKNLRQEGGEYNKLKLEISQLKIANNSLSKRYSKLCFEFNEKDQSYQQLSQQYSEILYRISDFEEQVRLLKAKTRDETQLPQLRGKALEVARSELKQLKRVIDEREQRVQLLEQELVQKEQEDLIQQESMMQQINDLCLELEKYKILNDRQKQDFKQANNQQLDHQKLDQAKFLKLQQEYNQDLDLRIKEIKHLEQLLSQSKKETKENMKQVNKANQIIIQKDKLIEDMENDYQRLQGDLKGFKERCKDYEKELENIKLVENNSMFGNQTTMIGNLNTTTRKYDVEIKQMKDMYTQQLTKQKDETTKYKQLYKEWEEKFQKLEEQSKKKLQQSLISQTEKLEKDQELLTENRKLRAQINAFQEQENELKDYLSLGQTESILDKVYSLMVEKEAFEEVQKQYEIVNKLLKEYQEIDKQSQQAKQKSDSQTSNFTRNLLMNKDKELEKYKNLYETQRQEKQGLEDKLWQTETKIDEFEKVLKQQEQQMEDMLRDFEKCKAAKEKSDQNVSELKEELRKQLRLQQESSLKQSVAPQKTNTLDEVERKKYDDLINMVLDLKLATDPLTNANLSLQNSYIDEFEQAQKHLDEQKHLVEEYQNQLKQELDRKEKTIQDLENEINEKNYQLEGQKREYLRLSETLKEKDQQVDSYSQEIEQMKAEFDKQLGQIQDLEQYNEKLRQENEESKQDMRKLMRTQDQLFNPQKKQTQKFQEEIENMKTQHETEIQALQEEIQQLQLQISQYNQKQEVVMDQSMVDKYEYRNEILEQIDSLIDPSSNKMPKRINELTIQLTQRIEKIRNQEKLKCEQNLNEGFVQQQEQKEYEQPSQQDSKNNILEAFKQDFGNASNEEELVSSIAKWLKKSQGGASANNGAFKNFFKNEDNASLMLSELLPSGTPQNMHKADEQVGQLKQQLQDQQQLIEKLHLELDQLKTERKEVRQQTLDQSKMLEDLHDQQTYSQQQQELIQKLKTEALSLENELTYTKQQMKQYEQESRFKTQQMIQQMDCLKDEIKQEFQQKTLKLDQEYEEMERQKQQMREKYEKQSKELESKYMKKFEDQERDFRSKLELIEVEIQNGCKQSQDQMVSTLYKELEDQHIEKVKVLKEEFSQSLQQLKDEHKKQVEDIKKLKDREIKRQKEDQERLKKQFEDKIKRQEQDFNSEKEYFEQEFKQKLDAQIQKSKKESKNQLEKLRAEMRNQIDNVKNDLAKQKSEWEREKKKLIAEHEVTIEQVQREQTELQELELKKQKEKLDKIFKKKFDDREKEMAQKLEELDSDIKKMKDLHKEDLKKERERLEGRLKDQLRSEVKFEAQEEIEQEFQEQLRVIREKQQQEIEKLKQRYEQRLREEQAASLPSRFMNESKTVEIQCDKKEEFCIEDSGLVQQQSPIKQVNQSIYSQMTNNQNFIDQLKYNFEEELAKQHEVFEIQLVAKQKNAYKVFEQILALQIDKVLQTLYFKGNSEKQSQTELDKKRANLDKMIADLIKINDDREEGQLNKAYESIKAKLSQVLQVFKQQLEKKYDQRYKAKLSKQQEFQRTQQLAQGITNVNPNKPFNPQASADIMILSQNNNDESQTNSSLTSRSESSQQFSEYQLQSKLPSPRHLALPGQIEGVRRSQEEPRKPPSGPSSAQKSGTKQRSDIKRYIEYVDEDDEEQKNILKKVKPVENKNGVMTVEVEKIIRDLRTLQQSFKTSKFYRLLMTQETNSNDAQGIENGQDTVQVYRNLLNEFFRMIVRLNSGVDQLSKNEEVYRLKLLNSELRDKVQKISTQKENSIRASLTEQILNYFSQSQKQQQLNLDAQQVLQLLEHTQFQINKLNFKEFQLIDLFTQRNQSGEEILNQSTLEINRKCSEFVKQTPQFQLELQSSQNLLLQSQSPDQVCNLSPEMLSPEETAQLISNIFRRINQEPSSGFTLQGNHTQQHNLESNTFFQTFMSNEEYMKSADHFIQKYREHQNQQNVHTQRTAQRQRDFETIQQNNHQFNTLSTQKPNNHFHSVYSCAPLQMSKKRCQSQSHSQTKFNNSAQLPNSCASIPNVFVSNLAEKQSIYSSHPIMVLDNQSQYLQISKQNLNNQNQFHSTNSLITAQGHPSMQKQSVFKTARGSFNQEKSQTMNIEELQYTQNNVNNLFQKLRLNLNQSQREDTQ